MKSSPTQDVPLLDFLRTLHPESSTTTLRSWIKLGRVEVDGTVVTRANQTVQAGQKVTFLAKPKYTEGGVKIIYEDAFLIVLDKPAGLLTVKSDFEKDETLHKFLKKKFGQKRVGVVHRLDQATSGVIVFSLNPEVHEKMKKLFESHSLERSYTAVVEGEMKESEGTWESYLYEDESYVVHETDNPHEGKLAITHYQVLNARKAYSLVEFRLKTGRKNQIRVQTAARGHPIVGDAKYGSRKNPLKRLALHAHLLSFTHPISKKKLRFESPAPEPFLQIFNG